MPAFWDSSALVPLCVPDQDYGRARQLISEHSPVVWRGTMLEILSALGRLRRREALTEVQHAASCKRIQTFSGSWREVQSSNRVRDHAAAAVDRYDVRAADALQIAAALIWCGERPRNRVFLARDERLKRAARDEGFSVPDL
jgi:predicted nucleic acid-binding protein